MPFDSQLHHRRSIRLEGYDYTQAGGYFVTLVTHKRLRLLGDILDDEVRLSAFGQIVVEEWQRTAEIRHEVVLDEFVVMPDHFHAVLFIVEVNLTGKVISVEEPEQTSLKRPPRSLGSLVAGFKAATTHRINLLRKTPGEPVWLRNYYEHILRDEHDLNRVRAYISANPARWQR